MEATEVTEFEEEVKEGGEKGLKHVSLIISILAVFVAMVTVEGHRTHTEAVLHQAKASDQWNEYQAKSTRRNDVQDTVDILSLQPSANQEKTQSTIEANKKHIEKWNDELPEEKAKAEDLDGEVRLDERKASRFDLAEAFLSIGVVLSSITLLTRQSAFYLTGSLLGIAGVIWALTGFLLK